MRGLQVPAFRGTFMPARKAVAQPGSAKRNAAMSVLIDRDGPVMIVTIDRPEKRNAVNPGTATALRDAFIAFAEDIEARVAILTGSEGHFCAGFDLGAVGSTRYNPHSPGPMGPTRMLVEKPVIAAIEGYAVAGGLELALWCDLRVAAESAVFGVYCRRWGVPLIDGGTVRLPRIVGGPPDRHDPDGPAGRGRRGATHRPRRPGGCRWLRAICRHRTRKADRRLPANLHEQRPAEHLSPVGFRPQRGARI